MGVSRIDERLFGKIDYKRARYIFHPDDTLRQALFVDSKAEKVLGRGTATIQTSQTSMRIRQVRQGAIVDEPGKLPTTLTISGVSYLTTSMFVKYNYDVLVNQNKLVSITIAALPNGMLQSIYNPSAQDTIWRAGRDAPSRGEDFRVRINFNALKAKQSWRVQYLVMPSDSFSWDD